MLHCLQRAFLAITVVALSPGVMTADGARLKLAPTDWPGWRGPTHNGIAAPGTKPPLRWSEQENVLWKADVPGRGHGSPTIVGTHVYLAAADPDAQVQSVLCYHRDTGEKLWQTEVHRGGFVKGGNSKSSHASSTVACDGERLFINFLNGNAVHTTALSREGKILWQTKIADYVIHQGYGTSPLVYRDLVLVSADNKGGKGAWAGLDRATGKVVWRIARPATPNYISPIVVRAGGREQLIAIGCDLVAGLDPLTGKTLWETKGSTTECVTTTVTDGQVVITSGGYPKNHVSAVRADGSGAIAWENSSRVYVPSMILHEGHLYAVLDAGVALCWEAATGKEKWKGRLGGTFSASLVLADGLLFATSEAGRTFLFKAQPNEFELVGQNQLGNDVYATPSVCVGRLYHRVGIMENGKRREVLYCIGAK